MSDEQKQPLWKKELSFGRKKEPQAEEVARSPLDEELAEIKAAAIAALRPTPVQPKAEPPRAVLPPEPEPEPEPAPVAEVVEVVAEEEPAAEQKVPFWKKELGGKKRPKEQHEKPKRAAESVPFWKKELGRRKAPAAKVNELDPLPVESLPPTGDDWEEQKPFWRRELSLGRRRERAEKPAKPERRDRGERRAPKLKLPRLERPARQLKRDKSGRSTRQKRLVGLKVGASQLAAARVSNNGVAELQQVARADLEHGIVVGGELRDPERLTGALRDFFKEHNLPKRGVRLGIANNRIGVRSFDIVGIDDPKQLENAIRFRAQEALPIPIEEAVLDYQVLGETKDAEGQTVKHVLLVVAYRELVDRYVLACRRAGVELVGIDLDAFALLRAMSAPRQDDVAAEAALVVVAIGHERSTFAVSDGRVCEFTRVLEWGGSTLNVAIARALDIAPSEAEPLKRAIDLSGGAAPEAWTAEQYEGAKEAVRRQIQSFARELVSSLQFYQNQPGSLGIGEIVLTGGTSHLPGLAEELQRLIGVGVRVGDPLARVKVGRKIGDDAQIGSLAVAIGLGIED